MKKTLLALAGIPALVLAAGPMDGTWITDLASAKMPEKPDVYVLDKGMYTCKSCIPSYTVKADGTDQAVSGHSYYDSVGVQVIDDHTVKVTAKKGGKTSGISTLAVSKDGKSMHETFEDDSESAPVTGKAINTRVAAGPAGSHAISGSWHTTKMESMSENGMTAVVHTTDTGMTFRDGNGVGFDAQFDGKQYPMVGDLAKTMVSVKRINDHTIEETDYRDGKAQDTVTVTAAPDGKTANFVFKDLRDGTTTSYTLRKK